jgi:hypothetical protein
MAYIIKVIASVTALESKNSFRYNIFKVVPGEYEFHSFIDLSNK